MQRFWQAVVALLAISGTAWGGIQRKTFVGSLTAENLSLYEKDGLVCLFESGDVKSPDVERHLLKTWKLSAPTVTLENGLLLAVDPKGETTEVRLVKEKGEHTRWTFEIDSKIVPSGEHPGRRALLTGNSGYRFRVRVAEGKYQGWYLAAEKHSDDQKPVDREELVLRNLKLVQDAKSALLLTYIDTHYEAIHK